MRLLLSCTELGLGHVSRIVLLGKKLAERGHDLFFFSGGTGYRLLKGEFENVYPCTAVGWYESSFGVMPSASLLNILCPLPRHNYELGRIEWKNASSAETINRYYDLRRNILKIKPDLIVSDGDIVALRLAYRWRIPSVYITNLIRPGYRFSPLLFPGERLTERYVKKCTQIVVPDNPEHTICEYNLGNLDEMRISDKVEFTGSFLDMSPKEGSERHIFASISGPLGTRAKLARTIIPRLSKLESRSIVSLGDPYREGVMKIGNCEVHSWLSNEERNMCMEDASVVVFSGGHGTCFEVIKHRKPSVCIPTQPEQMANARKLQELKCSISVENPKHLHLVLAEIEEKREVFKDNVTWMSEYSQKFQGLERATAIVQNLAEA